MYGLFIFISSSTVTQFNLCNNYSERHDLTFNIKSMCMLFNALINKHYRLPVIYLSNCECQFVNEVISLDVT